MPETKEFTLLTHEDEHDLDTRYGDRPRGGIGTLVRAVFGVNEQYTVVFTIHKSFMASSYYNNPSALAQQAGPSHPFIKAWRSGDTVVIKASHSDFASARSWTGTIAEKLLQLPEVNPSGGIPLLDIPWAEVPFTYQHVPSLAGKRITTQLAPHTCEVKACEKFLRIWLHRYTPPSKSRSQRGSKARRG